MSSDAAARVLEAREALATAWTHPEPVQVHVSTALQRLFPESALFIARWKLPECRVSSWYGTFPSQRLVDTPWIAGGKIYQGIRPSRLTSTPNRVVHPHVLESSFPEHYALFRRCFLDPLDLTEQLRVHLIHGGHHLAHVGLLYQRGGRPFQDQDVQALQALIPTMLHLIPLRLAVEAHFTSATGLDVVLESLPTPAFLVSEDGWILLANRTARGLWQSWPEWLPRGHGDWQDSLPPWVHPTLVRFRDGQHAWLLCPDLGKIEPDQAHHTPWAREWRLPPRLATVARLVAHGRSDKEIATELGLSWSTVRTYVHQVLTHAEVHSRGELAHLIHLMEAG